MPCHEIHCKGCRELYGKSFSKIHRWMDKPVEELGPSHQIKRHDIVKTPKLVAKIFGKEAKKAAWDHILLDTRWGESPRPDRKKYRFPQIEHFCGSGK